MKKVTTLVAFLFVILILLLSGNYLIRNTDNFNLEYSIVLSCFIAVNIMLLSGVTLLNQDKKNLIPFTALIMLLGGIVKSLYERTLPGQTIDDFIFTIWRFNDTWPYIIKVIWHTSLDWLVLTITVLFKNSYKLFEK